MEAEVEGRAKSLPYKVRIVSRESPAQKSAHVLDSDLRTHWSTSTNTKEWLVLELEESCLLSHIRIHNKSVLEWEISIGLRFKPDTYLKVRPRCEAPRRDVTYNVGYQPCYFVRISCLRGNPIAIFHIQLMGIPVPGLEPELQPVVDHVLPHIIAHIRDPHDIYLQLLQDIAIRLSPILSQLEGELAVSSDVMESSIRFFAMLVGPFYPILTVLGGRENDKVVPAASDLESTRNSQATVFTVSSNFQAPPKRVRGPVLSQQPTGHGLALRPDTVLLLLRVAYKDHSLGSLCRKVCRLLRKLNAFSLSGDNALAVGESAATIGSSMGTGSEEGTGSSDAVSTSSAMSDYSPIFGEEYRILDDDYMEITHVAILDIAAVEEGLLHILYACVSQPVISRRLADPKSDLVPVLPLIQAVLPALCPVLSTAANADQVDESFWQWHAPMVQRCVTQVMALATSPSYRPLLDACAGYLSSYSAAHEKAACVLIDLCAGPLAPWLHMVVAKIDLAVELLEDLLGVIQAGHGASYGRAALVYLMLALSGHVDNFLAQYKDVKHRVLFLIDMLEPFLIPAICPVKSTIAFGDVSAVLLEKQGQTCALALDLLHTAIKKPAVLPAMEAAWRRGHVTPSVLLSILAPHVPQPPGIDLRKCAAVSGSGHEPLTVEYEVDILFKFGPSDKEVINTADLGTEGGSKVDIPEDQNLLFAPIELKNLTLPSVPSQFDGTSPDTQKLPSFAQKAEGKSVDVRSSEPGSKLVLDPVNKEEYFNLEAEYLQLVNSQERELRALEFIRFAMELHNQRHVSKESHQAAIDALLLAAECHLNPFFMVSSVEYQQEFTKFGVLLESPSSKDVASSGKTIPHRKKEVLEKVAWLEEERDKAVVRILIEAAKWDRSVETFSKESLTESADISENSSGVQILKEDSEAEDALTLIRTHQELLCTFFVHQLQRERRNMNEVPLQGLLLILDSATRLFTPPTEIIEVILQCAERLNKSLIMYYNQVREGNVPPDRAGVYGIRRQWVLLRRLVLAASGGRSTEEIDTANPRSSLLHTRLIPAWAWIVKISELSSSAFPLVRYVGWMALARYAKYYKETGLLLVSDVNQLANLLLIFSDELSFVTGWKLGKTKQGNILMEAAYKAALGTKQDSSPDQGDNFDTGGLVKALYPELDLVFPRLRPQFSEFAEVMLESVCQLLKAVPRSAISDLLSWFSGICSEPFSASVKGHAVANIRFVILYLLEVIVVEHMEAIVPELPRVLEVLLAICCSSYSDVPLLESVLAVLKPIISHAMVTRTSIDDYAYPGMTFESLCFDAMMEQLRAGPSAEHQDLGEPKSSLLLFLAGSLLSDLSLTQRGELIASLTSWGKFTDYSSTNMYYNYLRAFQKILEECSLILQTYAGETKGHVPAEKPGARKSALTASSGGSRTPGFPATPPGLESQLETEDSEVEQSIVDEERAALQSELQDDPALSCDLENYQMTEGEGASSGDGNTNHHQIYGSGAQVGQFKQKFTELILAISPALEACWRMHPQLTPVVAHLAAKCLYYAGFQERPLGCPCTMGERPERSSEEVVHLLVENGSGIYPDPGEVLTLKVLSLQKAHCWQVASVTMNYLLSLLDASSSSQTLSSICTVLQYQCTHAPRVAWRLQTSQWLLRALSAAAMDTLSSASSPLIGLLCVMLEHSEPEQRLGALQQLQKLIKSEISCSSDNGQDGILTAGSRQESDQKGYAHVLAGLTWDKVATTAACDPSLGLRKQAIELLLDFVPFATPVQLRSFLISSDAILPNLTSVTLAVNPGPLTRLALLVLSKTCLYASATDVSMIPARVWDTINLMANAKTGVFMEPERLICKALLKLRDNGAGEKEPIKEILSEDKGRSSPRSQFATVRETVLEVLARLSAVWSKEDCAAAAVEELAKEVEEAEMELELVSLHRSEPRIGGLECVHEEIAANTSTAVSGYSQVDTLERLKQLKSQILAEEHANTQAAVAARREKQRIARRDRQLALEKAALEEVELLKELDRQRATEAEREIERQRILEKERAKTREMRHTLELEAERRTQREFQRELEQREAGAVRSARRGEFTTTSTPSSRPRERYRERESGRIGQEGNSRLSATVGSGNRESGTTSPATPTAAGGSGGGSSLSSSIAAAPSSKYISGFTQSVRDRDERAGYEDMSAEGNGTVRGEAGDGNNFGDAEGAGSSIDGGSSGGLASSQRQGGPRTSRPRQIVERRERDRREGKWERKQT